MSKRNCPVCGAQAVKVLYHPPKSPGPVGRCRKCGMVYVLQIDNAEALIFDGPVTDSDAPADLLTTSDLAKVQGAHEFSLLPQKERERLALRRNADEALDRITRFLDVHEGGPTVLDLGSGFGFFLAAAQARGWSCTGLEPLPASAVYARSTFGLDIRCDTMRDDTFPDGAFDVVTAFQVFEHLPYPRADLGRIYRCLRPGGLVLIDVPNIATVTVRILRGRHRHFVQDHLNFFAPRSLARLLERSGFVPVQTYFPARHMTLGHLSGYWGHKLLPSMLATPIDRTVQRAGLQARTVSVNAHDILAIIARKI